MILPIFVYMLGISSFYFQSIMATIEVSLKLTNNEPQKVEIKFTADIDGPKSELRFPANGDRRENHHPPNNETLSSRLLVPQNTTAKRIILIVEMDNNEHHVRRK